jgi:hypothetical protein
MGDGGVTVPLCLGTFVDLSLFASLVSLVKQLC